MNVMLEWQYKLPKDSSRIRMVSEILPLEKALRVADDLERTGRLGPLSFLDEAGVYWSKKELKKQIEVLKTEVSDVRVYFDGSYQRDTKASGQGAVLYYTQNEKPYRLRISEQFEALDTNNESEYAALWLAVRELENLGVKHQSVTFTGDSMVVVRQMSGEWPCYEQGLQSWMDRIEGRLNALCVQPIYELARRQDNKEADALASKALQGTTVTAKKEIVD